jgi:hypothetical protein
MTVSAAFDPSPTLAQKFAVMYNRHRLKCDSPGSPGGARAYEAAAVCRTSWRRGHHVAPFGEALVRAFDLETNIVRYPRIMVNSDVVLKLPTDHALFGTCSASILMSENGPMH